MEKRGGLFLLFVLIILSTTSVFATEIGDALHLNIQTTDSLGDVINGTFAFTFDISTSSNCSSVLYSNSVILTTDSRGIISHYLNNTQLNYSEQYWLCYYRNGFLIETAKIVRTPYTFNAKNTTLGGTVIDVNLNMGNYNITTTGTGFFGFLGSLVNRITSLFVQNIDFIGNINGTGNVTASYFIGDGSLLTGISSGGNVSWNETYANNIYAPKNYGDNWNKTYADTLYSNIQWNYNQTIATYNLYNDIWSSIYNSTYASYLYGLRNETLDIFTNYNSTWDNRDLIASVNTTANIQTLVNATYVPYNAATANVNLGVYNLTTTGSVGIGTTSPGSKLDFGTYVGNITQFSTSYLLKTEPANTLTKNYGFSLYTAADNPIAFLTNEAGGNQQAFLFGDGSTTNNIFGVSTSVDAGVTWNAAFVIEQTGNVGIGTSSPKRNLDILGGNTELMIRSSSAGGGNFSLGTGYEGMGIDKFYLWDNTDNIARLVVDTSGNVGIGTTSPSEKLDVNGNITMAGNAVIRTIWNKGYGGAVQLLRSDVDTTRYSRIGIVDNSGSWIGGMAIQSDLDAIFDGNVGIGTTTPSTKLEVAGNLNVSSGYIYGNGQYITGVVASSSVWNQSATNIFPNNLGNNVGIGTASPGRRLSINSSGANTEVLQVLESTDNTNVLFGIQEQTGGHGTLRLQNGTKGDVLFLNSNGNSYLNGGNVGIGTISPDAKLHIKSANEMLKFETTITRGSGGNYLTFYDPTGRKGYFGYASSSSDNFYVSNDLVANIIFETNGTTVMTLNSSGNVGIGTTTPVSTFNIKGYSGGTVGSAIASYNKSVVIGGGYNQVGYNVGNTSLLWIGDYSNDVADNIYPIYAEDENNHIDFFIKGGSDGVGTNGVAYFGGNVGIGTVSPGNKLEIARTGYALPATSGTTQSTGGKIRLSSDSVNILDIGTGDTTQGSWLQSTRSDNLSINTQLLLNPNGGNVGIGTATPDFFSRSDDKYLTLVDSSTTHNVALAISAGATAGRGAQIYLGQGATRQVTIGANSNEISFYTQGTIPLKLGTNDVAALTIIGGGNVGIGTASPISLLNLNTAQGVETNFTIQQTSRGNYKLYVPANSYDFSIYDTRASAERLRIDSSGNVGIETTSPSYKLDIYNGNLRVNGATNYSAGTSAMIVFGDDNAGVGAVRGSGLRLGVYKASGGGTIGANSMDAMSIQETTGYVGIPAIGNGKLSVRGAGTTSSTSSFEASNSAGATRFIVGDDGRVGFYGSDNGLKMDLSAAGTLTLSAAAGSGNDYACFNSDGALFRSNTAC